MKKTSILISSTLLLLGAACEKDKKGNDQPTTVYISSAVASPTTSETVTLKNNSGTAVDLTGWIIGDSNNPNAYSIPSGNNLGNGNSITFNASTMGFQINDSGETLYLKNSAGSLVDTWSN